MLFASDAGRRAACLRALVLLRSEYPELNDWVHDWSQRVYLRRVDDIEVLDAIAAMRRLMRQRRMAGKPFIKSIHDYIIINNPRAGDNHE